MPRRKRPSTLLRSLAAAGVLAFAGCETVEDTLLGPGPRAPQIGSESPPPQAARRLAGIEPLTAEQIVAFHSGKTIRARYTSGGTYREFHAPDGRLVLIEPDGNIYHGTWSVTGSLICYSYPKLNQGKPYCFDVRRAEGTIAHYFIEGPNAGKIAATVISAVAGNNTGARLR